MSLSVKRRLAGVAAVGASVALAVAAATSAPAMAAKNKSVTAAQTWAPADTAAIHPGTMMYTEGAQCTANFVYTDGAGNTYVGYAAHC
ncbi:MAG: hypothetical protein ACTHNT_02170, partial [Actinomycetales bacterium]